MTSARRGAACDPSAWEKITRNVDPRPSAASRSMHLAGQHFTRYVPLTMTQQVFEALQLPRDEIDWNDVVNRFRAVDPDVTAASWLISAV